MDIEQRSASRLLDSPLLAGEKDELTLVSDI